MSRTGDSGLDVTRLPKNPSRANSGHSCTLRPTENPALPEHVDPCTCRTHDGVCAECGYKITVGPSGTEYGHARKTNRGPVQERADCPHRPSAVDSRRSQGSGQA